jgi:hypothetical protein
MTKKDRIAVSISVAWLFLGIMISIATNDWEPFLVFESPLVIYWGYRFIQNDISFMRRNPKTANDKSIGGIATDVVRTFKATNKADELLKWNELLEKGAITQEEYDKAKRDLLG